MNRIFIIGPGGVGKTTCGKIFAEKISYDFVDTDFEFINRIGEIDRYIEEKGYLIYRNANSNLFYELIEGRNNNTVFALSSGFLADEIDLSKHSNSIRDLGLSILLLPSESLEETEEVVVKRQVSRGLNYDEKREREKIKKRFYDYQHFGDIKLFSDQSPELIAEMMKTRYNELSRTSAPSPHSSD
ncbi:MAG: hypothetical protein HRT89_00880 [Lentisphaeria bacterium]|nr:hypothetical protein [Lentisphaeria bacterium]NQZ66597.1 hypothetical protein [Lentisphaeria bacterium]